ncbi:MAG: cation transporter [Oscillospiraceae bacterium]|nr:cation transporter [Oscillospiraceae bacterium]
MNEQKSRDRVIIRTSVIGILANVLLASFKAFVGLMSNSIAIVMDAVNNISDAASSVITIVGTKLAGKEANKKHPFGYGRIEYISAMAISFLVLYAGITAFIESVKKIISPETPDYSTSSLVIVAVAVLVKIILGRYVKRVGEKVNSDSLVNSGEDATLDSVISASTLVAALIYLYFGLSLEAWLGAVIAAVIIKSGFEMLSDTLSKILGERADAALAVAIKKTIAGYPSVRGAYDLVLHNYGPDAYNGSVHIEVPDSMTAVEIDRLTRGLTAEVYDKYDVLLTGVGVYAYNTKDPDFAKIRDKVAKMVTSDPYVLQMHGFFLDIDKKHMRFDIVISFDAEDRRKVLQDAVEKVEKEFPSYTVQVTPDIDFSEILES